MRTNCICSLSVSREPLKNESVRIDRWLLPSLLRQVQIRPSLPESDVSCIPYPHFEHEMILYSSLGDLSSLIIDLVCPKMTRNSFSFIFTGAGWSNYFLTNIQPWIKRRILMTKGRTWMAKRRIWMAQTTLALFCDEFEWQNDELDRKKV